MCTNMLGYGSAHRTLRQPTTAIPKTIKLNNTLYIMLAYITHDVGSEDFQDSRMLYNYHSSSVSYCRTLHGSRKLMTLGNVFSFSLYLLDVSRNEKRASVLMYKPFNCHFAFGDQQVVRWTVGS